MLLSGRSGVGKTWGSIEFPDVFYIDVENGASEPHYLDKLKDAGALYMGPADGAQDAVPVVEAIHQLITQKHDRKTVILDSITKWWMVQISEAEKSVGSQYGADKKEAIKWMRRLIRNLDQLDMNVLLVAHAKPQWDDGTVIGDTFDCWDKLEYELDLWCEVTLEGSKRIATVRKSRVEAFPVGKRFPWSYDTFADAYGRSDVEAKSKATKQSKILEQLIAEHEVPEATVEKWLEKAGVTTVAKLPADIQKKCIDFINDSL